MDDFVFKNPTKIIFGKGAESKVGAEARESASKVLLHFGGGSIKKTGLYDRVVASLKASGVAFVELGGVEPNPHLGLVKKGIEICRKEKIGLVLAVGGGSAIDSAKAIALGVPYAGDVWDFYAGNAEPAEALPVGTILTIPAAGSEASTGTVITKEEGLLKRGFNSELIYPRFSILNPELAFTLPPEQIAYGAADIMSHLLERYFTNSRPVEFTDRLIEATLKTVIDAAPRVLANRGDYDSMAELMWAGTIAHNNLLNTGRVGDWATHDLEHEVSAIYNVAHGAGLAALFPSWMRFALPHDPLRFAQIANRVWGIELVPKDLERAAHRGIQALEAFWTSLGLATRLGPLGVKDDRVAEMAEKLSAKGTRKTGNFVKIGRAEAEAIYRLALR
ncbi:MAG TPA: iron-containing alcohol dehydrogenase [Rectinemataceae bacterium]|nr:iron-containing alcohol dehydrogenase [Rectinemataceae bacterium]